MAEYSIRHKLSSEYSTSNWSGGTTTELGIGPEESRYADRNFLWRISSATVDLEESTFTALPDYDRIIMTLAGDIDLCHNGGDWLHLKTFETHSFEFSSICSDVSSCAPGITVGNDCLYTEFYR